MQHDLFTEYSHNFLTTVAANSSLHFVSFKFQPVVSKGN